MQMSRRRFGLALLVAPAIIRTPWLLMPVKAWRVPPELSAYNAWLLRGAGHGETFSYDGFHLRGMDPLLIDYEIVWSDRPLLSMPQAVRENREEGKAPSA